MAQKITVQTKCPGCKAILERDPTESLPQGWICGRCQTGVLLRGKQILDHDLNQCILCNHGFFYVEKDFPKLLRFLFMGTGIGLSFFTYGISLFVFAGVDFILYQFLPWVRICYNCQSEYRGFPEDKSLKTFDPHKGVAYDARRTVGV